MAHLEEDAGKSHRPTLIPGRGDQLRKRIGIIRAHLEEDAGKSMHDEVAGKADSRIDLNRAGTPLLEIVSQPDLRSPAEAKAYLTELKLLLNYLGVSDCNMQEGSLRVDANINLHIDTPAGQDRHADRRSEEHEQLPRGRAGAGLRGPAAVAASGRRRATSWATCPRSTRGWDEASQTTREQRSKEESSDYRYFPDPDLVPVTVTEAEVERVRASLGELPAALRTRLEQTYGITPYDSDVLVNQGRALVDYYIELADACGDGKAASNWVQQDVLRWLSEQQVDIGQYPVPPKALAELIGKVRGGAFDTSRGREVLGVMVASGKSLAEAIDAWASRRSTTRPWSSFAASWSRPIPRSWPR